MEEEANSWLRRAKFSHTVCHRLDTSRLASIPVSNRNAGLKTRPETSSYFVDPYSTFAPIQRNPSTNKPRYVSPTPQTKLSDSFREARSDRKRFSTPHPRGRDSEKGRIMGKLFHRDSNDAKLRSTSPLKHLSSLRFHDKGKNKRENSWSKYFDGGAGRVSALEMADEWMVDLSKLFLGLKFAHGAHSQLYHGIYKDEAVAVKIIRVPDDDENGALAARLEKQFTREVTLLSRLHHQNVIKFIAACRKPPVFCVITEYLSEGSLRSYLHKLERKSLPLEKLMTIALDIARGMEYIHSQGVLHRDLKPENILICEGFHMKIADFGIACEEAYCDLMTEDPGTYRWMAPEMIKRKLYGRKVDVYSFGLILWELVAGAIPYEDMTPIQAAFAVVNKNMRPAFPGDCHPAMRALIEQCWSLQPEKRPEFWQIVKILEQFEQSIALDGTLDLVQCPKSQDPKKGLLHRIQKLGSIHHQHTNSSPPMPKPRFM